MKEIKPMQLWTTYGGDRAFITEISPSDDIVTGVVFSRSGTSLAKWSLEGFYSETCYGFHGLSLVECIGEIKMYEDSTIEEASNKYVSLDYFLEFQEMVRNKFAEQDRGLISRRI